MRRFLFAIASLICLLPGEGRAADVIGTGAVDGRKIEILRNFTWRFADQTSDACFLVDARIDFCGASEGWEVLENNPGNITAAFVKEGPGYAFFIAENAGGVDGLSLDSVEKVVVQNLATAMGIGRLDVPIFETRTPDFYEKNARTIAARVFLDGSDFVFINTFWVDDESNGQVFTYAFGSELRESDWALHNEVTGLVSFKQ